MMRNGVSDLTSIPRTKQNIEQLHSRYQMWSGAILFLKSGTEPLHSFFALQPNGSLVEEPKAMEYALFPLLSGRA
jgi:hypothetical protein